MKMRNSRLLLSLLLVAGLLLAGCADQTELEQQLEEKEGRIAELQEQLAGWEKLSQQQEPLLSALQVVQLLQNKDFAALAARVHPEKGLRFTPYPFIEVEQDLVFSAEEVAGLMADDTVYQWGLYDGSGHPIELTFADYYQRFVYDHDFAKAEVIGYNHVIAQGNCVDNVSEAYPDGRFVEFHYPGSAPEFGGADWRSLKLVFEQQGGIWYLVGIVHGEWTI